MGPNFTMERNKGDITMFEDFSGKIIWSADGISLNQLLEIIEGDFPRESVAIKLDRLFLTKYGLGVITEVQKRGVPVFADAKIIEIPTKTQEIAKLHLEHSPWMLNVMAGICNTGILPLGTTSPDVDELYHFANLCAEVGTKSCVVTVLTSKTYTLALDEFSRPAIAQVEYYTKLATSCGITDLVCSPIEARHARALSSIDINTPGIRLSDSSKDDQARVNTPAQALANGANRLVIGRDLSRDGKFAENLAKIMANINGGV